MVHLPNIEKALKIEVTQSGDEYRADPKALPGTPIVGLGKTEAEAKYNLCVNWIYMFVRYNTAPTHHRQGGDMGFVPIITELLKKDLDKTGLVC